MTRLNLRHLHSFWLTAREGSIAKASELLDLAPQTLSGQISALESHIGRLLFKRQGRALHLTEFGITVQRYADNIFSTVDELDQVLQLQTDAMPVLLRVGIAASIHKLIAFRLLQPLCELGQEWHLDTRTAVPAALMQMLKTRELDLVLTDQLMADVQDPGLHVYELGESTLSLFATPELAQQIRPNFPHSLDGQPFLANRMEAPWCARLMQWLEEQRVRPLVRARIDDSALLKVFGAHGLGVFAAPTLIADEVCRQYQVERVGVVEGVRDQLFAVTRRALIQHAGVKAVCLQGRLHGEEESAASG